MSPTAVFAEPVLASLTAGTALVTEGISSVFPRLLTVAVAAILFTGGLGILLIAGVPTATRTVRDDSIDRPDLSFAVGFVGFFGLLVVAGLPLFVGMSLEHPAADAAMLLISLPGLFLWAVLLALGSAAGAIVLGDRIATRFGDDSPSLVRSLAIGAVVLGSSQLLPVVGVLLAMGVATVTIGATVRRRTGIDERLFETQAPAEPDHAVWQSSEESASSTSGSDRRSTSISADSTDIGVDGRRSDEREWSLDDEGWPTDEQRRYEDGLEVDENDDEWSLDWGRKTELERRESEAATETDGDEEH